jgi:hypothetical protein
MADNPDLYLNGIIAPIKVKFKGRGQEERN